MTLLRNLLTCETAVYEVWFAKRNFRSGVGVDPDAAVVSYLHLPIVDYGVEEDPPSPRPRRFFGEGADRTAQSSGEPVSPEARRASAGRMMPTESRVREPAPVDRAPGFFDLVMEAARGPSPPQSGARILLGGAMGMERPSAASRTDEDVMHWTQYFFHFS